MKHDPAMSTLPDALDWLRARWDGQRTAPERIHAARVIDSGGAPEWSPQFTNVLSWRPGQARRMEVTIGCGHPLNGGKAYQCPECDGAGVKTVLSDRYLFPMTVALIRLRRAQGRPHPLRVVYALAFFGWRPEVVEQVTGCDAATQLRAIRQLHGRYEAGPMTLGWLDKSESQQNAEVAA